jgi:hypothetical protein
MTILILGFKRIEDAEEMLAWEGDKKIGNS